VIQQRYPQIAIHAANYPPPPLYKSLASVANIAKWAALGTVILGERLQIFQTLNIEPPSAYTWSQEHKVLACFAVWFFGNSVEGGLVQTGAFEVELNGMPIWSKLKSGRIPQGNELFDIINNQLSLSNKSQFTTPPPGQMPPNTPPHLQKPAEAPVEQFPEENEELPEKENTENNDFEEFDNEKEEL